MKIVIVKANTPSGTNIQDENGKDIGNLVTGFNITCRAMSKPRATIYVDDIEIERMEAECDSIMFNGRRFVEAMD